MRTLTEIKEELDRAIERRAELWEQLGRGAEGATRRELAELSERIAKLWEELRTTRVRERFGSPEPILQRAERDKRLERELDRAITQARVARRAA